MRLQGSPPHRGLSHAGPPSGWLRRRESRAMRRDAGTSAPAADGGVRSAGGESPMHIPYHDYRPESYTNLLDAKVERILGPFQDMLDDDEASVSSQASPKQHFRLRCRFAITASSDGALRYTLYSGGEARVPVDAFPIASEAINALMPRLIATLEEESVVLKECLEATHFLDTLKGGHIVVTLIYSKHFSEEQWLAEARDAAAALSSVARVSFIGISKGRRVVFGDDFVTESFGVTLEDGAEHTFRWRQVEGAFSNPNGHINRKTMEHICGIVSQIGSRKGDLLDLYCGNGNYTVPLSRYFRRVCSVELSPRLVDIAHANFRDNSVRNVDIVQMDCMQFSKAVLEGHGKASAMFRSFDFEFVLVDPPRAGLDPASLRLISRFDNIVYISCMHETLREALGHLHPTYRIVSFRVFDHFPYTKYAECVVHLKRRREGE